jgi:hypothetical protein
VLRIGKARRALFVFVASAIAATGLTLAAQPAQAAVFDRQPEVTCTSANYPQFASDMADFIRIAVNTGTVVRYDGLHEPGVAFYDYVTGTECYTNTGNSYKTASMVKASILGALLYRSQEISDAERPLVEKMILESDNDAALTLWTGSLGCGKDASGTVQPCTLYRNFLEVAGMDGTYPDDEGAFGDTHTTARDQVRLFRLFSSENSLISPARREYALNLLERAEPRYGVTSFAPPNTRQQLKVGFSKLGEDENYWRVNVVGRVVGGAQGYNYIMALLSDRNEELPHNPWPFNGIARVDRIGEQVNCGVRELNGDTSCWSFKNEECFISSPQMSCQTDHPLRSHRSQHWVRVDIGAKLGSTVHWRLVDAANGIVVDEGDAVGGPNCVCHKTVYGLYGSYVLKVDTNVANGGDRGAIANFTDGGPDPGANQPPVVNAGSDHIGNEGSAISITGFANDDGGPPAVQWSTRSGSDVDPGGFCTFADPTALRTTVTCNDDGTFVISLSARDGVNAPVHDDALLYLSNVAPALSSSPGQRSITTPAVAVPAAEAPRLAAPQPWQTFRAGQTVTVIGPFVDPGSNDTQTCQITWDDGTVETFPAAGSACDRSHVYQHAGMYTIKVDVTDDDGGPDSASVMVVVYDPAGGFATSGASLDSPAGALRSSPDATGRAHLVFNPKYLPGDEGPAPSGGKVMFRFDGGGLNLESTSLEWLVVTLDGKVAVKGTGTVSGKAGYGFVLYGYDDPDKVRLVVWSLANGPIPGDTLTYDNRPGAGFDVDVADPQPIATGSIQLHG